MRLSLVLIFICACSTLRAGDAAAPANPSAALKPNAAERAPAKWVGLDELFVPPLTMKGQEALLDRQRICFLNLHRRPNDMDNLSAIAEVQLKLGRYALAADYAQRLVAKDPTQQKALRIFNQALYFAGQHELAVALNRRSVQLGFDDPINRLFVAEMHIRKGDPVSASVELVRVIGELDYEHTGLSDLELRPIKLFGLKNQAELYRFLGRDAEYEACLELIKKIRSTR